MTISTPAGELAAVRIVEVGPRDGLQNESSMVSSDVKVAFVNALTSAGNREIEVTSFVNPRAVPQMADAADVLRRIDKHPGVRYSVLIPNEVGLDAWIDVARDLAPEQRGIALFTAASETFNLRNIGASIDESFERFQSVLHRIGSEMAEDRPFVRGYVSTVVRCPYEGAISPSKVAEVVDRLFALGVDEVSLGDTIGAATPADVDVLLTEVFGVTTPDKLALHLHDTRGTALANVLTGLQRGIRVFDSSAAGLGGCPFAPGASGNLATEDLVYMLNGMGIDTGVDLAGVAAASDLIRPYIDHDLPSRELRALLTAGF